MKANAYFPGQEAHLGISPKRGDSKIQDASVHTFPWLTQKVREGGSCVGDLEFGAKPGDVICFCSHSTFQD